MFVGNTLSTNIIQAWYIMNDSNFHSATRNDTSAYSRTGTWTNYTGGDFQTFQTSPAAPAQVPAYTSTPGTYGPNQTTAQWTSGIFEKTRTVAGARFSCGGLTSISGQKFTVSGWVQASQGTWGNTPAGTFAVIAANSTNINSASFKGFGLYFYNNAGTWQLYAQVGNGTTRYTINSGAMPPTPGTWYYVVMTFNANLLSLYVNGSLVASTTTSYTSVPAGAFATVMGIDPATTGNFNWFFGCMSNFWFANDCATSTLVSQAFGLSPATGGAGGGASGGPSASGGAGLTASGATGGAGEHSAYSASQPRSGDHGGHGRLRGIKCQHGQRQSSHARRRAVRRRRRRFGGHGVPACPHHAHVPVLGSGNVRGSRRERRPWHALQHQSAEQPGQRRQHPALRGRPARRYRLRLEELPAPAAYGHRGGD